MRPTLIVPVADGNVDTSRRVPLGSLVIVAAAGVLAMGSAFIASIESGDLDWAATDTADTAELRRQAEIRRLRRPAA
jgi:hypothetical protein